MEIPAWLSRYEPQAPLDLLVEEVNKIYHSFDAKHYDREHPEIHQQLPAIWAEMVTRLPQRAAWRVLDFGCGTGFEAHQLLQKLTQQIESVTLYDPSPEMLAQCRVRLQGYSRVTFCEQLVQVRARAPFNLLLTNSLLHHLPKIHESMSSLLPCLAADAYWLAGHEPSVRFYQNNECLQLLKSYSRHRELAKWFEPVSYLAKLRLIFGQHKLSATAQVAFGRGLFRRLPSHTVIDKLVDFHVAHSLSEIKEGRGLDFEKLQVLFRREWKLCWKHTYSFLGPFSEVVAPKRWLEKARELGARFPEDGANFCLVWSRESTNGS